MAPDSVQKLLESIAGLAEAAVFSEGASEADRRRQVDEALAGIEAVKKRLSVDANGKIDPTKSVDGADVDELLRLREDLRNLIDVDGPTKPPYHIMRRAYAPTWVVIALLLLGTGGTLCTLWQIVRRWPAATGDFNDEKARPAPSGGEDRGASGPSDGGATDALAALPAADAGVREQPRAPAPQALSQDELKSIIQDAVTHATKRHPIKESDLLCMIILMGMLGGFVHLTSSLSRYVGSRQFLRSWIIWYMLMPISGGALAPMVYLLLRVGVLSNGTANLNVFGLYGFAALTGLFAEQAIEMLAKVFSEIFTKVQAKDEIKNNGKGGG